jgi:outer membrane usher protein
LLAYGIEPPASRHGSEGSQAESWGFLGIPYISRDSHPVRSALPDGSDPNIEDGARFKIVNASYSVNVSSIGSFRLNGYRDLTRSGRYGISASFNMLFGKSTTASLSGSSDSGRATLSANLSRGALEQGDIGFCIQNQEGSTTRRSAEFEYYGRWGRATAGIEQSSAGLTGRVGARGSLAFIDGSLFASDHIDDSFAVVRTGNIPVQYENRPIGITNSHDQLIVPSLRSYQNNRLSLDPSRLPSDIVVGQTFVIVRPHNGSGIIVDLPVKRVHAAVVRLYDNVDKPVVSGSTVQIEDGIAQTVGYDGEAFLQDLQSDNRLNVTRPDGSKCTAHVGYQPVAGDIPIIGSVPCHRPLPRERGAVQE